MNKTTNLSALCVRLRDDAVKRVSGGFGHDAEQLAEWAKHTLEWEAADRIEELEGIVRELIDANEDRAKKAVHHGKAHEISAWIDALGRMKATWDKARAALGE